MRTGDHVQLRKALARNREVAAEAARPQSVPGVCAEPGRDRSRSVTTHGIVLAGVHAWSRCPLDQTLPRPLLPIANRALISYVLDWLHDGGIGETCVCGNSQTFVIRDHLTPYNQPTMRMHFYADFMPRGPAGCVRDAARRFNQGDYLVVDGTLIPRINIKNMLAAHAESGADLTVVIQRSGSGSHRRSAVMSPVGIYVFSETALSFVAETGYQDIKEELVPRLYAAGRKVCAYVEDAPSPRVTGADTYLAVNDWMVEQSAHASAQTAANLHPGAQLIGPVILGRDVRLETGVMVVGPTSIGNGSYIGEGAIVCRSSIWEGATVGAGCVVDRSVLTSGACVPPGVQWRNAIRTREPEDPDLLSALIGGRRFA